MKKLSPPAPRSRHAGGLRKTLLALFFCSGISGLIFEVVWTRQLTVILGNTVYAVSTVLAVFMTGLALGSFVGGRIIDRREDVLRVYACLEVAIGVLGLCLSSMLNQTGPAYVWIHHSLSDFPLALSAARYVFAFGLLVVPTTLMGATLPVMSRFVVASREDVGLDTGRLYALNTLGAALGCFAAGFLLIGTIGIASTVRIASAASLAVGISAWFCWKRLGQLPGTQHERRATQHERRAGADASTPAWTPLRVIVLIAFAISGLTALGYEVVWTRLLTQYLGNSIYAFCAMLTTFLVGIALGSLVFSAVASRNKRNVAILGLIEVAIALYVLFSMLVFSHSADWLQTWMDPEPWWEGTGARFLKAFALLFVPTFLMGAAFPVAGQIYVGSFRHLGQRLGELYACNTLGAILGPALAGFVLLPLWGLQATLLVLLCLNLVVGLVLCALEPGWQRQTKARLLTLLVIVTVVGWVVMPRDVFRRNQETRSAGGKLLYYKEDVLGAVTVRQIGDDRTLAIDNLDVAGTSDECITSQKPLGHLPVLLHPNPHAAYVLGFGGGGASHAIATHPEIERIDASELSQSVLDVTSLFRRINHDVISDPRLHVGVTDGRHYLLTTQRKYDVISVDLLWPQTAGASSLYTLEFYRLCHGQMNDDGIMVQWLHPGSIPTYYLKIVVRTIGRVFPHTSLWWAPNWEHIFVMASKSPLRIDMQRLTQRMKNPNVKRDLAEVALDEPAALLALYIAHDEMLTEFVADSNVLNTDDLPLLEYGLPLCTGFSGRENTEAMTRLQQSVIPLVENASGEEVARMETCELSNRLVREGFIAIWHRELDVAAEKWNRSLQVNPGNYEALKALEKLKRLVPPPQAAELP